MRKIFSVLLLLAVLSFSAGSEENNDFYDNSETYSLKMQEIIIKGDVSNPGRVDPARLQKRSVLVREAFLDSGNVPSFTGAYRYDGYSLFDILKERYVDKADPCEFEPVIELLVLVENNEGDKAVFSWGEIFYPDNLHRIIIATDVSRIVPTKSGEQWPLPETSKLVCSADMISERNISNPTVITVLTQPMSFPVERDLNPLYSEKVTVHLDGMPVKEITSLDEFEGFREYPSIFYGRGRGFHGIRNFSGKLMKSVLKDHAVIDRDNLRAGYLCVAAADGYRITLSLSEVFNRNDNADFLLVDSGKGSDGGRFLIYPAPDFFSDRAVKAVTGIYFRKI